MVMNISINTTVISIALVLGHCFQPSEGGIKDDLIDLIKSLYYNYIAVKPGFPATSRTLSHLTEIKFYLEVLYDHHRTKQYPECKDYKMIYFYNLLTDTPSIIVTLDKAKNDDSETTTVNVRHDFVDGKIIISANDVIFPGPTSFGLDSFEKYSDPQVGESHYDPSQASTHAKEVKAIHNKFFNRMELAMIYVDNDEDVSYTVFQTTWKTCAWIGWPKLEETRDPLPLFTDNMRKALSQLGISYEHYERASSCGN